MVTKGCFVVWFATVILTGLLLALVLSLNEANASGLLVTPTPVKSVTPVTTPTPTPQGILVPFDQCTIVGFHWQAARPDRLIWELDCPRPTTEGTKTGAKVD